MPITRRNLLIAGSTSALFAPGILRAQDYRSEYKLSVVGSPPLGIAVAAERWASLVAEQSEGRINIKVYTSSQLVGGDSTREQVAMQQGVIDMLVDSTIYLAPQINELNLFSLPFLMRNNSELDALIAPDSAVRAALEETLARRGAVNLAWSHQGFRQLTNSVKPVRTPDDLKGMKIRYPAGEIYRDIFDGLGANPLQMNWADLQPALATGTVDGMETPVNVFRQVNLDTLNQMYYSLWYYVTDAVMYKVAQRHWDTFSEEDRQIIRSAAETAAAEHVAQTRAGATEDDRSSIEDIRSRGVQVEILSDAEKQAFADATDSVFDKWAETTGPDLVASAQSVLDRVRS